MLAAHSTLTPTYWLVDAGSCRREISSQRLRTHLPTQTETRHGLLVRESETRSRRATSRQAARCAFPLREFVYRRISLRHDGSLSNARVHRLRWAHDDGQSCVRYDPTPRASANFTARGVFIFSRKSQEGEYHCPSLLRRTYFPC